MKFTSSAWNLCLAFPAQVLNSELNLRNKQTWISFSVGMKFFLAHTYKKLKIAAKCSLLSYDYQGILLSQKSRACLGAQRWNIISRVWLDHSSLSSFSSPKISSSQAVQRNQRKCSSPRNLLVCKGKENNSLILFSCSPDWFLIRCKTYLYFLSLSSPSSHGNISGFPFKVNSFSFKSKNPVTWS